MATIQWDLVAEMADGTEHKVIADQRDLAEWEDEPFGSPFHEAQRKAVMFSRYLAWSAMVREGLLPEGPASWKAFKRDCREVRENSAIAGDQVDPGEAAPADAP